jgi:signal transduction histidine kinase
MCQARRLNVRLSYSAATDMDRADELNEFRILGDEHKLAQVVRNLVSNGLKFTPPNGQVTVSMSTFTKTSSEELFLRIDVKDTGAGISEVCTR